MTTIDTTQRDAPTGVMRQADVARVLGINPRTLQRWIAAGQFPKARMIGRLAFWLPEDIRKALSRGEPA
jgi:predicted DNA-binding transcriptional regulator AlpA